MWELDCEEDWASNNWCVWTVVLKTLEGPLDCKEIQPVHSEGDQPWDFFGRKETSLEVSKAETPVLWPPHGKNWLIGKDFDAGRDWGQEEKGTTENEMSGWHHWLDERESEWTPGAGDGQGGPACCDSWGCKESDMTERLNWTELKGDQSWVFIGRSDVEAESPILWPPNVKSWLIWKDPDAGKDWGQEEKGTTEDEMVGWHHPLNGHEFVQALGVGDGQRSLVCCSPRGHKESDTTGLNHYHRSYIIDKSGSL